MKDQDDSPFGYLWIIAIALIYLFFLWACPAEAKIIYQVVHPTSTEQISLSDEQGKCPKLDDGQVSREAFYHDPRDGQKEWGCYLMDGDVVLIVWKNGQFGYIPLNLFKPSI